MHYKKAQELLDKYKKGECTKDEIALLESWIDSYLNQKDNELYHDIDVQSIMQDAKKELKLNVKRKSHAVHKIWYGLAAVILLVLVIGSLFSIIVRQDDKIAMSDVLDVEPGGNTAELILADGSIISLDSLAKGAVIKQGTSTIEKKTSGQLYYAVSNDKLKENNVEQNLKNEIRTPKGGQYQVTLPDGTLVWLNAGSSIKFSSYFSGKEARSVELRGEAYFDVKKHRHMGTPVPFIVNTPYQNIEVLGTEFNVNAYDEEAFVHTTLIEGKVKVSRPEAGIAKELKPGQQAVLHKTSPAEKEMFNVSSANLHQVTAWKNGMFVFDNLSLPILMRQIGRWYDVEIDTKGLPNDEFSGEMSRDVKLSQLLEMIEIAGNIKFKLVEEKNRKERRLIRID